MVASLGQFVDSALSSATSAASCAVTAGVASGDFVVVLVGDGYGYGNSVTGVTDSQGNTYNLDVVATEADGDGSVFIASSLLTTALTTSDTISVAFDSGDWTSAHVVAFAFSDVTGGLLDVAGAPVGGYGPVTLTPSVTGTAVDLLIGFAAFQNTAVGNAPTWTALLTNGGDVSNVLEVAYQFAESDTYTVSGGSSGDYSAAVAVAYSVGTLAPPAASASPSSLTFGSTPVDTDSTPQTVTITNAGDASLIIGQAAIGGTNFNDFEIINDNVSNATIGGGDSVTLQIVFSPIVVGARAAVLSIPSNDPASPVEIDLAGTCISNTPAAPFPVYDPFGPHSIRYLFTTLDPAADGAPTSAVIAELPCTSVSFSLMLNQAGPFSATFNIEDASMRYGTDWIKATNPGKTFFWVDVDGVLIYGGRILQRDLSLSKQQVTITGSDFYSYWTQRLQAQEYGSYIQHYFAEDGTEYVYGWASPALFGAPAPLIAWQIFRDAMAVSGSLPNLTFPYHGRGVGDTADPDTWVTTDTTWITFSAPKTQRSTVDTLAQELLGLGFGVGFDVSPGYAYDLTGAPQAFTYIDYPRRGTALADYADASAIPVLDLSTAIDIEWSEDASSQATGIVEMLGAAGGSSGDEVFNDTAMDTYNYPLVEQAITHITTAPTPLSATVQAQLEKGDRVLYSYPQLAPVITLPAFPVAFTGTDFNLTTGIGTRLGNDITVFNPVERQAALADGGNYVGALSSIPFPPPGFEITMRVVGIDVTIADAGVSTMALTLNQPPADTVPPPPTYDVDY